MQRQERLQEEPDAARRDLLREKEQAKRQRKDLDAALLQGREAKEQREPVLVLQQEVTEAKQRAEARYQARTARAWGLRDERWYDEDEKRWFRWGAEYDKIARPFRDSW